jgi:hypothetical protein
VTSTKRMAETPTPRGYDPVLLLEALLVLVLIGLSIYFYIVPAGEGRLFPDWWTWPILGVLFFGILFIERWRRKRRGTRPFSHTASGLDPKETRGKS